MSIAVEDFHKNYDQTVAVAGINFRVDPGEILGLVGPNGAGKTTTLRALAGILRPTRGRLAIAGHDLAREPVIAKAALAYVPDEPRLFDQLTLWEHFRFIAAAYRLRDWRERAEALLAQFELTEKRDALTAELSRKTSVDEINAAFKAAAEGKYKGILQYNVEQTVSVDYNGNPASSIFDSTQTAVADDGKFIKVFAWYDNEWGFSNRMVDVGLLVAGKL